jgi:membrane-bound lytic murein transglycosylase B
VTLGLALAAAGTVAALPVGLLAAGQPENRLQPVRAAYAAEAAGTANPTAQETNADGSTLTAKLAYDPDLAKTLASLQEQVATTKADAGTGRKAAASAVVVGGSVGDIPAVALAAYRRAEQRQGAIDPGCHITWSLLAGIGRVESSHGTYGGSQPDASGVVHPAILGPVLDGSGGNSAIHDTDGGQYDGDTQWDRAVGPMQFIPSSWATGGRDGNGDGIRDPENLFDAALAAANYLCASGGDLRIASAAERAVLSYNHSWDYVLVVRGFAASYAKQDLSAVTNDVAKHATKPLRKVAGTGLTKPTSGPRATPTKRVTAKPVTPAAPIPTRTVVPTRTPTPTRAPATPSPTPTLTLEPTPTPTPSSSVSDPATLDGAPAN